MYAVVAVGGRQRVAEEAAPHPVDAEVRERLGFRQLGGADRAAGERCRSPRRALRRAARARPARRAAPRGPPLSAEDYPSRLASPSLSWRAGEIEYSYFRAARRFSWVRVRRFAGGCAGVRWGSTPDPGRSSHRARGCDAVPLGGPGAGCAAGDGVARGRSAHAGSRRARCTASNSSASSGWRSGTRTGTPVTHLPGYSLLFAPLASLIGLRLLAALSRARLQRAVRADRLARVRARRPRAGRVPVRGGGGRRHLDRARRRSRSA